MRISVADRLEIADKRTTSAGYLAVRAKIARDGVYQYTRGSIGLDGDPNEMVGVYRSHDWVFDSDNLATFAHKPICVGHPNEQVNSANWKKLAVGQIGDKVWEAEDRKHVQVDMLIMDQAGIEAATTHSKELSAGYSCEILAQDGVAPDGTPYVAVMSGKLIADHVALVPRGRAGSHARIGDAAWPIEDLATEKETPKVPKIVYDGLTVDLSDAEATQALITKLTDKASDETRRADNAVKALTDAEVLHASALKDANDAKDKAEAEAISAKKALEDAKVTPEQLRDAAKAYAALVDAAGKIAPEFAITDSMTEADIRKGVVLAKFGDSYAGKPEGFFDALFEVETGKLADEKPDAKTDAFRDAMAGRKIVDFGDAAATAKAARDKMIAGFNAPREAVK